MKKEIEEEMPPTERNHLGNNNKHNGEKEQKLKKRRKRLKRWKIGRSIGRRTR